MTGTNEPRVDPDSEIAPYIQLADIFRRKIGSGELRPGARLPSIVQMAGQYGTARTTAHKAMKLLLDEGLIVTSRGRGYFVKRS